MIKTDLIYRLSLQMVNLFLDCLPFLSYELNTIVAVKVRLDTMHEQNQEWPQAKCHVFLSAISFLH